MIVDGEKRAYENELKNAEEKDDPLASFYAYLLFLKERLEDKKRYIEVLKETTSLFCIDPRYTNDPRYVHCFVLYSEQIETPEEVYAFMKTKGIGRFVSLYYEGYSQFLEARQRFDEALWVLKEGITHKATPLKRLEQALSMFIQRNRIQPLERKGYKEELLEDGLSFEECRARDKEETLEAFIEQNKDDILFLDSENSSDLCLPSFLPLVSGVQEEEEFTQIDIFKDNTMDTRELHLRNSTPPQNILRERIQSVETSPFSDLSQVDFSAETICHSKAVEAMNRSFGGGYIESSGAEMIRKIEAILGNKSYERAVLCLDKDSFFIQKKFESQKESYVYLSLDVGTGTGNGSKIVVKAKKKGLRGEKKILDKLSIHRITPKPISFVEYSDFSFLVMENIDSSSLFQMRPLLCRRREREAVSLSMFFSLRILQAVKLLHRSGIIHGDISCENILPFFGNAGLKEESPSFSPTDSAWSSRGIFLCGLSRSIDLDVVRCDVSGTCKNSICSAGKHGSCFEADLHGSAYVILLLILPQIKTPITGTDELRKAIENTKNNEQFVFKEMWKDILVLLLNRNSTKEDCLNALNASITRLETCLVEYDKQDGIDRLGMSLKRIEMDMYENSFV